MRRPQAAAAACRASAAMMYSAAPAPRQSYADTPAVSAAASAIAAAASYARVSAELMKADSLIAEITPPAFRHAS